MQPTARTVTHFISASGRRAVNAMELAMGQLELRLANDDDIPAIVDMCSRSLGWRPDEPNETLFRWKHVTNPFGPSPIWIALTSSRIVGVRPMMRWEFTRLDGSIARAVRAVDTATDPEFQGRGIFRDLTELAIEELTREGVHFVFNTPNSQSRPGYLKLGWHEVGRVRIVVRATRWWRTPRLARARVAAAKWSEIPSIGHAPGPATAAPVSSRWRTRVDAAFVDWRYGLTELSYRAVGDVGTQAVFRVRRRGSAREATLADVLGDDRGGARRAVRELRRGVNADYLLATQGTPGTRSFLVLPRLGPRLVVRPLVAEAPELDHFDLRMSDVELF
jgi:GNAT superfamily N-acetyltransferase